MLESVRLLPLMLGIVAPQKDSASTALEPLRHMTAALRMPLQPGTRLGPYFAQLHAQRFSPSVKGTGTFRTKNGERA